MKSFFATTLVALAAGSALAAPLGSVTFTNVESRNLMNSGTNVTLTHAFAGPGTVRKIDITGGPLSDPGATATWSRESSILITPPGGGAPFIAQPYGGDDTEIGAAIPAGRFTIPVAPAVFAGTWSFQFFDYWDDTADDSPNAVWSTITFGMDDAAPTPPAPFNPAISTILSNVAVTGTEAAPGFSTTWNLAGAAGSADTIIVRGLAVGTGANTAANINASPTWRIRVRVTPPGRPATAWFSPFRDTPAGFVSTSASTGELAVAMPGGVLAALNGAWLIEIADQAGTSTSHLSNLSVSLGLATPPTSTAFPALVANTWVSANHTFAAAGAVKWYSVSIPTEISAAANSALDFDMEGTVLAPDNDAAFALFSNSGARMGFNFSSGTGALPLMSFGKGTRNAPSPTALPYEGGNPGATPNGATANAWPTLPAGTYFLAVVNGDTGTTIGPALYSVTPTTETNAGTAVIRARYFPTVTPEIPAPSNNLGTAGGSLTRTANLTVDFFKWYKIAIPSDANDTTGKYLDIDTANTPVPLNDTNLGLYDSAGALKSSNDDIAPGWGAANPTGGNSALSFGMGATPRSYAGVNTNMPDGDGRDGVLTAGTYYLHVSPCCTGYGANNFWVLNDYVTNPDSANITVHVNSNYPFCSNADVGKQGGIAGRDNFLNNDDFVVFINLFFANDAVADVGIQGGQPGQDEQWNNDDFVVFINYFFNDQAACTG